MTIIFNIFSFIVNILVDGCVFIIITRTILLWRHAERINPAMQFITKLTNPLVKPIKRWLPDYQGIEIASIALIIIMEMLKLLILCCLALRLPQSIAGLLLTTIMQILEITINVFCYGILMQILGKLTRHSYSGTCSLLDNVTLPLLTLTRRWIPNIKGIDISAIAALLLLQLALVGIIRPLLQLGLKLTFGYN